MKNIIKIIFSLCLISVSSLSFAYCVYNNAPYPVDVKDTHIGGMERHILAGQSACCDSKNFGCRGNMQLYVYNTYDESSFPMLDGPDCKWEGKIDGGKGHYFVVTSLYYGLVAPCAVKHYHD